MAPKAYVFFKSSCVMPDFFFLVTGRNVCPWKVINRSAVLTPVCSLGDKKADGKEEKEIKGKATALTYSPLA